MRNGVAGISRRFLPLTSELDALCTVNAHTAIRMPYPALCVVFVRHIAVPRAFGAVVRILYSAAAKKQNRPSNDGLWNRDFSECYRTLSPRFARCPRRQKQSPGLFSSARLRLAPSWFESHSAAIERKKPPEWVARSMSRGYEKYIETAGAKRK